MSQRIEPSQVLAVIPARFASQRFPGKLAVELEGRAVLSRVIDQVSAADRVGTVLVATDDDGLESLAREAGAQVVRTRPDHPSGSDRIGEAVHGRSETVVLNVQGDEPLVPPSFVNLLVELLEEHPNAAVSTLAAPLEPRDLANPNVVKVVRAETGRALYFSRAAVPASHPTAEPGPAAAPSLRHVGLYGYRRAALDAFLAAPPSPLERREGLEQLRLLERGSIYQVGVVDVAPPGVDTPEDLARCAAWLRGDAGASGTQRVG